MTKPLRIKEAVVVEGRYDKAALAGVVDTVILETAGFGVFKDGERLALLRRLAAKRGLIVLTDSDGAGFVIRNHLKGVIPQKQLKHAYIPDVYGKERRKQAPGREGKLGVEGVDSNLATAIRTGVVLVMAWGMVAVTGKGALLKTLPKEELGFICLSGVATGASWLCYYRALQAGPASVVVPIDKLSILVTVAFSGLVFHERLSPRAGLGLALITGGTLVMLL